MAANTYDPEKAKQLYKEVTSIAKIGSTEDEFYEKLNDPTYANKVYNRFKTKYNTNLLGAADEKSFVDSLNTSSVPEPELSEEERIKPKEAERKAPVMDSLKIQTPESFNMNIPQVKYTAPEAPNMQLELTDSLRQESIPFNPEQSFNIRDIIGETPQQRIQAEINTLGEDAVMDSAKVGALKEDIQKQIAGINSANEEFLKEYEANMRDANVNSENMHHDSWSPMMPWSYKKNKKAGEYITQNSERYDKIQKQKQALQRQYDLLETYGQYADFGRSVEVGKRLSAMVGSGAISEDTMKILRSNGSEEAKEQYLGRLLQRGKIDKETIKEIYNLGDLTEKNGLGYGLFKTGKAADMLTFGVNEIAREMDIANIANRVNAGKEVSAEEMDVLNMYLKLAKIKEKAQKDFGFWFNAGMGMQESLRFMAEMALTGGVGTLGKQLGVQGAKSLILQKGMKSAMKTIAKNVGEVALKSAGKQALLTPLTPSAYRHFSERLTGLAVEGKDVSGWDKVGELYKSYAQTFAERFSESLGNIASDVPLWTMLNKGKATRDLTNRFVRTFAEITDNEAFKQSAEILKNVGIAGIPEEILSELSGTLMTAALTWDSEALKEFTDPNFYGQVALQSAIMGGMGGVVNYTAGGIGSAIHNKKMKDQYERSMNTLNSTSFNHQALEDLRVELMDALRRQDYINEDESAQQRPVANIIRDMNTIFDSSTVTPIDAKAMDIVDNAVRIGAYRYGEQQAIKSYVEDKIGAFENTDGNVYEVTDTDGTNYFILDSTDDTVVLHNRNTGKKVVRRKDHFQEGSIKQTNGNEWAMNEFLLNINRWNQENNTQEQVKSEAFIPATHIDLNGQVVPVKSYDPQTGKYTISDEQGNEVEVSGTDEGVTEIWGNNPQAQTTNTENTSQEVNTADSTEGNTSIEPEVQPEVETPSNEPNSTDGVVEGETTEPTEEIEYDENGDPVWSKTSPERGKQEIDSAFDEDEAKAFVADKIKAAEKAVKSAEKKKPKAQNIRDRKAEIEQIKAEREQAKANLDYWNTMSQLYNAQPVEEAPAAEAEQTTDIPLVDDIRDNPVDARARGYRSVEGVRYDRQQPMQADNLGNDVQVKFAEGVTSKGKRGVIEADEAQPSHINGVRNPKFFLNEAQPKDRTDKVSMTRADRIAQNIRPEEITGGVTAYTGSPVVNTRKEAIQGNNRLDALKKMYQNHPEQAAIYKQYLIDHATEWGLDPQAIAAMNAPILVDVIDVTDEEAIKLGQRTSQDTESGGEQAISAQNVAQTLGSEMKNLASVLFRSEDEEATIDDLIEQNGYDTLKWLAAKKAITETQMQTALDGNGNLTPQAKQSLKDILSQNIFKGGNNNIRKQFTKLPKAAQKALLQTIARELDSTEDNGILSDIQEAIEVYSSLMNDPDFKAAKGKDALMAAAESWSKQMQMDFTEGNFVPEDRYSKFALALAVSFKAETMKQQTEKLNQLYDYLQAEGGDIFNPAVKLSKADAVKEVYGVELKDKQDEKDVKSGDSVPVNAEQESTDGGQGSSEGTGLAQQNEQQSESTDSTGRPGESETGTTEVDTTTESSQEIEITEELIDSLPVDDLVKLYAKQYINGKQNTVTRSAYQTIEEYVQNESRVGTRNSTDANTTQLDSRTNDATVQQMGTDWEQSGSMDRGQSDGDVSAERPSGENSEGGLFAIPGEGSNSGVEQETSDDTDNVANNGTAGGRSGSKRSNVRKSRGPKGSTGVSADAGQRGSETQSSIDDKIKSADDLISDALAEIENILKKSSNTLGSLGNAEMFKLIPATAKLGYALTKKGFYTFQKWFAQMQKHIGPLLQKHLTIEQVDEFIRDMWDTDFPFNGEVHTVAEWASIVEQEELRKMVRMSLEEKVALQKSRENVETLVEDLDNIRESLPFLLPQQQEDVYKAEVQFFSESHKSRKYGNGKGILFTNGTGTGKTYTGLGIVKRFVKQGKGRILIVTAQDKKIKDWIRDASNLGIEATQLKDTKDKGKGVVVTQFANMYQNRALLEDEWDLIVYDESHKLMESKDGRLTSRAVMHHMLSNRDLEQAVRRQLRDHELFKKEYELRDEMEYLNELLGKNLKDHSSVDKDNFEKYGGSDGVIRRIENIGTELDRLKTQQDNLVKQTLKNEKAKDAAQKAVDKTKVVFLSASPFNTAKNLDYVESYIFSYNPDAVTDFDGVRLPSELRDKDRDNFVLEKFPSSHYKLGNGTVQMRSEQQINNPEQSSQEEIDFSESLQQMGTLSGRTLDSEWDYSRQFPKFDFAQAEIFNRMYEALQRGKYVPLKDYFKIFTEYNLYTEYFEAIKTSLCLDRIKEHVELGRKVVVFHRRRSNTTKGGYVGTPVNDCINDAQFENEDHRKLMNEFVKEFADFLNWERTANLDFANYQITEAFATEEEKTQYQEDLKKWQNKVKEARDKGVKKLPDRPTIKTKTAVVFNGSISEKEKRDNAERFNDPNSNVKVIIVQVASGKEGVDLHDTSGKFPRAEVNLYLPESPIEFIQAEGRIYRIGNKSNAVFEYPLLGVDLELASFAMKINGRAQTSENLALGTQSRGLRTSISRAALSSRPIEVSAQQGVGGKQLDSKQEQKREDFDDAIRNYNEWKDSQSDVLEEKQVPDPIGERMAYWAMPEGGDTVLVPYAGEGSVARYVDSKSRLVAYEASMARFSRLAMLCGGSGRKIENKEYLGDERYYSDNILYFNLDQHSDIENKGILYALNRLADSGRMVILTTASNAFKDNISKRNTYDTNIIIRAEIKLPGSIMGIENKSLELLIIDNLSDVELQKQAREDILQQDLSNIKDETELWESLRNIQIPTRIIDNIAKTRKRTERALDNYIASSPMVKKRTEYSSTGKNKLVPKVYKSNDRCSFDLKHEGYVAFRYGQYTKGNPLYSSRSVESLANAWLSRQEYIKENENSTDKYRIEKVESYKAMCNFIEALLDKTPPQLRNLALGINENVITGEIDVPTLKDSIKGMIGNNAAFERLNDRVMKVAEAYGVGVEIVSSSHPKFADKSRNIQGFYSPADGKIWIRDEFINSARHSNDKKAEVLLHEAIHSVTSHVIEMYKRGEIQEGTPLYDACRDIMGVYEAIKNDPMFISLIKGKDGLDAANNEYGLTDEHEMLAELANPVFRAALKAKKLWRQLINGIKMLLGIQIPGMESTETNALNALENALEVLLDNADINTFNRTKGSGLFNKIELQYKKKSPDTVAPTKVVNAPAVPSDYIANIKGLQEIYKNRRDRKTRGFITDVAKTLSLTPDGSSHYRTFSTPEGDITFRISNHNSVVSNFDERGEDDAISIVVSGKKNKGITNDGKASVREFFYSKKSLAKAEGKPLVKILESIEDFLNTGEFVDKTGLAYPDSANIKSSNRYRLADGPMGARQHSEEVMRESIDKMAQDLGVNAEYVSDEKQLNKKGWYDPATGKVYVNLADHETIDDAKATYLHEVVGHFGLRGLLKDKFEDTMTKIFNSLPKELKGRLLEEYGSEIIAAEEYLSGMIESDIEPSLVEKILGFIREAIRSMGINLDNYTNGDLEYLLWRSKNNLRENVGKIEAAQWGAKNTEMRYRSINRPAGYKTNTLEMSFTDKLLHSIQDRMRPVKKIMDEVINRGGVIDETSDPHSQEFLSASRAASEIEDFKFSKYEPLAKAIADAMKVFTDRFGMTAEDARTAVNEYLYARHAPERNKRICVNEIVEAGLKMVAPKDVVLVNEAFKAELRRLAEQLYDNQFRGGKNTITPSGLSAKQTKLAMILAGAMQNKTTEISKEKARDEDTGTMVLVANNRSGMSDAEAEDTMNRFYTPETKAALDEVSAKVKDCTNFTLDKWLEYGLISRDEYNAYQNQYEYYIPLRGWDEKGENIDYLEIPSKQFNQASELINLNRYAKGRLSKAADPLAYIASLAQSACVTGNRNLIRQMAFNMVSKNEGLMADLAVIENTYEIYDDAGNVIGYSKVAPSQALFDQGRVKVIKDKDYRWHKTGTELGAHRVPVMIDGVRHTIYFKGKLGALAATAINGTDNDTRNVLMQGAAKTTRFISANLTARNITFLTKNLIRDLGFGSFAYFIENGMKDTAKMHKEFFSAMRTAAMDAMNADKATYADSALYDEFKRNGGQTGYVHLDDLNKLAKEMNKMIKDASNNRGKVSQEAVNAKDVLFQTFDVLGKASENAMRFAIYKMERQRGATPREAAIRAKEITVNFNRQGKNTKYFSSVYAFFNPAVQGAYRFGNLIAENPKRATTTLLALVAIKFGLGMMCEMFSGGDDDEPKGESAYDRLSDYVKATNWVIPLGWLPGEGNDDKFLCIPLPQSVRAITYASDLAIDMIYGRKTFGEAIKEGSLFTAGEFLPFDIDAIDLSSDNPWGTILQAASPTLARPVVENILNRDFMGNPITKEPFVKSQDYIPQYQLAFRTTSPILVGTSKFLNELAGGDEMRSAKYQISENGQVTESGWGSFMDVNPAKIEHLFSGYFGGMFDPLIEVYDTMRGLTSKDIETQIESISIANQFIKGPTSKPGYKKFYDMRDTAQSITDFVRLYGNNLHRGEFAQETYKKLLIDSNLEIVATFNLYNDALRKVNENIALINSNSDRVQNYNEKRKELEAQRDALILEAANKYREICDRRDKANKEQ